MRWIRNVLKVKDWEKKRRARELEDIEKQIRLIEEEMGNLEKKMDELNQSIKVEFSFEKLVKFRTLLAKERELKNLRDTLIKERESKKEELKSIYKDIKAVEVVKGRLESEFMRKENAVEMLRSNFFYLIKKFLVLSLLIPALALPQGAIQKKIKEKKETKAESELKMVTKELEEKLKRLEEERKRLEKLKQVEPKKEEVPPDFQKLIAIFNRADTDEAGAIMNNMDPNLAAEILLKLKDSQAAAIISAMDPQKAAEVSQIMARKRAKKAP
ncbi:magnesium transporter MgtE N-terminal domain-containing protein [Thermocrinis sp.]